MYWLNMQGLKVNTFVVCCLLCVVCCWLFVVCCLLLCFVHELDRQLKHKWAYQRQTANCLFVCVCVFGGLLVSLFVSLLVC